MRFYVLDFFGGGSIEIKFYVFTLSVFLKLICFTVSWLGSRVLEVLLLLLLLVNRFRYFVCDMNSLSTY